MRPKSMWLAAVIVALLIVGLVILSTSYLGAPPSDVGAGRDARAVDAAAYQCSTGDPARCECERTAVASALSPEAARNACKT